MRTIINSFRMMPVLVLICGISFNALQGQMIMKSGTEVIEHRVASGTAVKLQIQEFRGNLQWQTSDDGTTWTDWEGETGNEVEFAASDENYLRVAVSSENCDPVFSETVHVIVLTGPIVITSEVRRVAATEAYSGGQVTDDAGETITGFGVCWSTEENPTTDDSMVLDDEEYYTSENFTSYISELEPNTTYYVRAFAMTSGETAYGNQFSFTTDEASGTFIDERDQNEYKWVYIGGQKWMAENLAWLPVVSPPSEGSETQPKHYVLEYEGSSVSEAMETDNYSTYGVLYNIIAAMEGCPSGWHLPSDVEWKIMEKYLGMRTSDANSIGSRESGSVGGKLKETGTEHWKSPNGGANNSTGFTALPGGVRGGDGNFYQTGENAFFWLLPFIEDTILVNRSLQSFSSAVGRFNNIQGFVGNSVRCVKNAAETNTPPTASLIVDPAQGTSETRFMLDASGSRDNGTNPDDLEVRWDFDGDGNWDTGYNYSKILFHQFTEAGSYTVILEVTDSRGLTDTMSVTVVVN